MIKYILLLIVLVSDAGIYAFYRSSMESVTVDSAKLSTLSKEDSLAMNILDITVKDINGNDVPLSAYKGKVLLIVNVASYCGYTKQYKGLQELYSTYKNKGLEILAFPCNDFGSQEPGTNEEIKEFCSSKYNVTFQLFDKITVKGENINPLFARLIDNPATGKSEIKWNFEKFLVNRNGDIVARFRSGVDPLSDELLNALKKELE